MKILAHSYVCPDGTKLNGKLVFDTKAEENPFKAAYQQLGAEYPKFYKMDVLSKMAFIGTELLLPFFPKNADLENDLLLLFANSSSSQHTDNLFVDSYQKLNNPSPSLFVYTLPNIVTGELSIRNKWYGENCFFIEEQFNAANFTEWAQIGFNKGNTLCLGGWVEAKTNGEQECFLFLLSPSDEEEALLPKTEVSSEKMDKPKDTNSTEIELSTLIKQYRNE